jgi:hypothetical protein
VDPERKPEIVDLARYKQAAKAAARRKAAARPPAPAREPLLGSRPRAGLILLLVAVVIAAVWALSHLG